MRSFDWRRHRSLIQIAAVLCIGVIVWVASRHSSRSRQPPPASPENVVTVLTVHAGKTPIIRRGLGQVQAYNTDSVKSRVDGNITRIGYTEGQHVNSGDLLIQIDPRPFEIALEQARAALSRDQVQLTNARRDLARDSELVKPGLVTEQAFDAQRTLVRQLSSVIALDEAQAHQAQLNLEYATIKAPFSGRTGLRLIDVGNLVHATDATALVVLTQTEPIFVQFTLPERYLDEVRGALQKGRVEVDAFDADDQHSISHGALTVVDNTVDPSSGTVRFKAEFPNTDEALWPGEFVNAHVIIAVSERGFNIPAFAVQQGTNGRFVFRVSPQGKAEAVAVEISQIEGADALIEKGLREGDRVIVDGAYGLANGARISIQRPGGPAPRRRSPPVPGATEQGSAHE